MKNDKENRKEEQDKYNPIVELAKYVNSMPIDPCPQMMCFWDI